MKKHFSILRAEIRRYVETERNSLLDEEFFYQGPPVVLKIDKTGRCWIFDKYPMRGSISEKEIPIVIEVAREVNIPIIFFDLRTKILFETDKGKLEPYEADSERRLYPLPTIYPDGSWYPPRSFRVGTYIFINPGFTGEIIPPLLQTFFDRLTIRRGKISEREREAWCNDIDLIRRNLPDRTNIRISDREYLELINELGISKEAAMDLRIFLQWQENHLKLNGQRFTDWALDQFRRHWLYFLCES